ncbi:MAG: fatty acid desaturase [Armatimonadota bacterium]
MSTTENTRINWYRSPLDKELFKAFTTKEDAAGFRQIIPQLALTAATGAGAYFALLHLPWYAAVPAVFIHATVYSFLGLSGAGHELSHATVFRTHFWNEFFMRLVAFLTYTNYVHFRASHPKHHLNTVHAGLDLEVVLPQRVRRWDWFWMFVISLPALWNTLRTHIRHSRGIIRGEWEERIFPESEPEKRRALANWARVVLIGHLLLAAAFLAFGQWPLLLLVTFAPFTAGWLNFFTGFTQHVGLAPNVPDHRLCCRTVLLNPLLRFLYWNMNYHIEHHMYPGVPFHQLGQLHQAIAADLPASPRGLIAAWREIFPILRRQADDPDYVFVPALPGTTVS